MGDNNGDDHDEIQYSISLAVTLTLGALLSFYYQAVVTEEVRDGGEVRQKLFVHEVVYCMNMNSNI